MQSNLKFLIGLVILLAGISYFILNQESNHLSENQMLVQELKGQINDIDEIHISKNDSHLTFNKNSGIWTLAELDNYFADINKIANLLMELRNMNLKSKKTSKPENYANLSLADSGDNSAIRVLLKQQGQQVADLYLGKKAKKINATYVRKGTDKQTWLASGAVNIELDSSSWIVKTILNIEANQLRSIEFDFNDQQQDYAVSKITPADKDFLMTDLADNKQAKSDLNSLANGLVNLTIENPIKINSLNLETDLKASITYTLFNGNIYILLVYSKEDKNYLSIKLSDKHEYADFEKQLTHWLFEIPSYKYQALTKKIEDLIEEKPVEALDNQEST